MSLYVHINIQIYIYEIKLRTVTSRVLGLFLASQDLRYWKTRICILKNLYSFVWLIRYRDGFTESETHIFAITLKFYYYCHENPIEILHSYKKSKIYFRFILLFFDYYQETFLFIYLFSFIDEFRVNLYRKSLEIRQKSH